MEWDNFIAIKFHSPVNISPYGSSDAGPTEELSLLSLSHERKCLLA